MGYYLERLKRQANQSEKTAETAITPGEQGSVSFDSSFRAMNENFARRTCGTCRHALLGPDSHPRFGWRWCGLGWVGGLAGDDRQCHGWHDAASMSRHDPQVDRAKTLIASGWSPWNAAARARSESEGQP